MKHRLKPNAGFSTLEGIGFLLALGALAAITYPAVIDLQKQEASASQAHATSVLEAAKNQFDQESKPASKETFEKAGDGERFTMLSHLVTPNDPAAFTAAYGLETIRINEIGKNVEVVGKN